MSMILSYPSSQIIGSKYFLSVASTSSNELARTPSPQRILQAGSEDSISYQFLCDGHVEGCNRGLWNQDSCECDCIPPFCRDSNGVRTIPTGNWSGNPWANCQRAKPFPWRMNGSEDESCTTGNRVRTYLTLFCYSIVIVIHSIHQLSEPIIFVMQHDYFAGTCTGGSSPLRRFAVK